MRVPAPVSARAAVHEVVAQETYQPVVRVEVEVELFQVQEAARASSLDPGHQVPQTQRKKQTASNPASRVEIPGWILGWVSLPLKFHLHRGSNRLKRVDLLVGRDSLG